MKPFTRRKALKIGAATAGAFAAGLPARLSTATVGEGDRLYVFPPSATSGDTVTFHVASSNASLKFWFYRAGPTGFALAHTAGPFSNPAGTRPSDGAAGQDWLWPGVPVALPTSLATGAYAVYMSSNGQSPPPITPEYLATNIRDQDPVSGALLNNKPIAMLVVRSASPNANAALYVLPFATFHAYNLVGGGSFYENRISPITIMRPGGGLGHVSRGSYDVTNCEWLYDPRFPQKNGMVREHYRMISWLERSGYPLDYCSDWDLEFDVQLGAHPLWIFCGHPEYWGATHRQRVESFIMQGGNVAFLGANTCWWHIAYNPVDSYKSILCNKDDSNHCTTGSDLWSGGQNQPEEAFLGLSYRFGVWNERSPRENASDPRVGYTVQYCNDWIYEDTELGERDTYGQNSGLIGFEADGLEYVVDAHGYWGRAATSLSPTNMRVLGRAILNWENPAGHTCVPSPTGNAAVIRYRSPNGGLVFNGGTIDWARVVEGYPTGDQFSQPLLDPPYAQSVNYPLRAEPAVEIITRNVLNRLISPGAGLATRPGDPNVVVRNGSLLMFVRGANGTISKAAYQPGVALQALVDLTPPLPAGVKLVGRPAIYVGPTGQINLFVRGEDETGTGGCRLWNAWQQQVDGPFVGWADLGCPTPASGSGLFGEVSVSAWAPGPGAYDAMIAFGIGKDGRVYCSYEFSAGSNWSAWIPISSSSGPRFRRCAAVTDRQTLNFVEVSARAEDGSVAIAKHVAGDLPTSNWPWLQSSMRDAVGSLTAARRTVGQRNPEVLSRVRGPVSGVAPNQTIFCGLGRMRGNNQATRAPYAGDIRSQPSAVMASNGRMQVFSTGASGQVVTAFEPAVGRDLGAWMDVNTGTRVIGRVSAVVSGNQMFLVARNEMGALIVCRQSADLGGCSAAFTAWEAATL